MLLFIYDIDHPVKGYNNLQGRSLEMAKGAFAQSNF